MFATGILVLATVAAVPDSDPPHDVVFAAQTDDLRCNMPTAILGVCIGGVLGAAGGCVLGGALVQVVGGSSNFLGDVATYGSIGAGVGLGLGAVGGGLIGGFAFGDEDLSAEPRKRISQLGQTSPMAY